MLNLLTTHSIDNPRFKTLGGKTSITWSEVMNLYDLIIELDYIHQGGTGQETSKEELKILHLQMLMHSIASGGFNLSSLVRTDGQFLTSQLSPRMVGFIELNIYQIVQGTKLKTKPRNGDDNSIYISF